MANKVDLLSAADLEGRLAALDVSAYLDVVSVSALRGDGLDEVRSVIAGVLAESLRPVDAVLPYNAQELLAALHRDGVVESERYEADGVHVRGSAPPALAARVAALTGAAAAG